MNEQKARIHLAGVVMGPKEVARTEVRTRDMAAQVVVDYCGRARRIALGTGSRGRAVLRGVESTRSRHRPIVIKGADLWKSDVVRGW